ncbi:MAG: sigma-54 dependent transcriptional regulator [Planctomycetes bacterium]|nr:sigma-54 dependent transcriptional regulator [Planctomycetota bacterium]
MDELALIADVAGACVGSHTRAALARRVAAAAARHLPLRALALAWADDGAGLEAVALRRTRGGWEVEDDVAPHAAAVREALAALGPLERPGRGRGGPTLVLPLFEAGAPAGGAVLTLASARGEPVAGSSAPGLLRALAAVLLVGHRACRTIERVAATSLRAHEENRALRRRMAAQAPLLADARSPVLLAALSQADLVAEHDTTVLLRGESGTGKGVLARRIHARSARAGGPFVHVDCAALPPALVESELFGHEAGAFTGATRRHVGKVERAAGGTLFLDEVGELLPTMQGKLLRLLQEGRFERVGGERPLASRARVIAATHRPLEQMIVDGQWRADLYHRLAVFPIHVPPLRERPEDVPPLVEAALARAAARLSRRAPPRVTDDALARLVAHPWPGNARELENLLERAAILARGGAIDGRALDEAGLAPPPRSHHLPPADGGPVTTLDDAVRAALARALRAAGGRIYGPGGAAALLGLKPSTLQTKMAALGLRRADFLAP